MLNPTAENPDAWCPGLMAVGEAGCASVHGANRLGSNSLIDLVVFGRAAAIRAGKVVDRNAPIPPVNEAAVEKIMARFDRLRHANGSDADRGAAREDAARHAGRRRRVPHPGVARKRLPAHVGDLGRD